MRESRRKLIAEIIDLSERVGRPVRPIRLCQLCGREGEVWGWAGAVSLQGRVKAYVALGHGHGGPDEIVRQLDASDTRWCEWCAAPIARDRHVRPRLCARCADDGRAAQVDRELQERRLRRESDAWLQAHRDRLEREVVLDGTAWSRELAVGRLALRRIARWRRA